MNDPISAALCLAALLSLQAAPSPQAERARLEKELLPVLQQAVEARVSPGAVLEVGSSKGVLGRVVVGRQRYEERAPEMEEGTLFDLASLTKVVSTTTLCMRLTERGLIALDEPVAKYVPEFRGAPRERVTVRMLLTHCAGLPAWQKLYQEAAGREEILALICAAELEHEPGTTYVYSDLGMMLLGLALERAGKKPLDELFAEEVAGPLGLEHTGFNPAKKDWPRCAPTEECGWRKRLIQGEVHDENAYALGGVSAHAGLFSTAAELGVLCRVLLSDGKHGDEVYLKKDTVALFTRCQDLPEGSTRALGWGTNGGGGSSCGASFSKRSFGHTGFTGTSIWCDPERDLYVVLLTNRVYPSRENRAILEFRPRLHAAVVAALPASDG